MGIFSKTIKCPKCKSVNVEYLGSETVGRKTKKTTSLNLNPLKPFTVLNHKEKVVNSGFDVNHWHCKDCGKVFTK